MPLATPMFRYSYLMNVNVKQVGKTIVMNQKYMKQVGMTIVMNQKYVKQVGMTCYEPEVTFLEAWSNKRQITKLQSFNYIRFYKANILSKKVYTVNCCWRYHLIDTVKPV